MNNLLKPKTYEISSSQKEVYMQEKYYELSVVDSSGVLRDMDYRKETLEELFEAFKNYRLKTKVKEKFSSSRYITFVKISEQGNDLTAKVTITKRWSIRRLIAVFSRGH